jgi:hypothetical protein
VSFYGIGPFLKSQNEFASIKMSVTPILPRLRMVSLAVYQMFVQDGWVGR